MTSTPAHPARSRQPDNGYALRGLLVTAVAALAVTASGCGGQSESRSCFLGNCRYTITTGPGRFQSSDFDGGGSEGGAYSPPFDFTVTSLAPGRAEIDTDPHDTTPPTTVIVGGTVQIDGTLMRLESSDGQTATLAFPVA